MSGSIAGNRIPHSAVQDTIDSYRGILKQYPQFKSLVPTGSTTDASRESHGDLDVATYLEGTDMKQAKKDFMEFLNSLPDDVTVPFRGGRNKGKKCMMYADIVTCQIPIVGFEGLLVQIDNAIVLSEEEQTYKKSFLDIPGEKQALLMGLARVVLQEENPEKVFARLGIKKLPELDKNQEFEFVLSPTGLTLRKVTLQDYKETAREDIWKSKNWSYVEKLFKDFDLSKDFDHLLADIAAKGFSDRSKRRIKGIVNSTLVVGPGEVGKPKGDNKERAKNSVSSLLGEIETVEEPKGTVALYGGGFKPPHKAHFANAEKLSKNADRLIIFIGPKVREGVPITAQQSEEIWNIYKHYLHIPVEVRIAEKSPISSIYDLIGNPELSDIKFVIGKSQGAEEDKKFAYLLKNQEKYSNVTLKTLPIIADQEDKKFSASTLRKSIEILKKGTWMPSVLDRDDARKVLDILLRPLEQQALQEELKLHIGKAMQGICSTLVEDSSGTAVAPTSIVSSENRSKLEEFYNYLLGELDESEWEVEFRQSFIYIKHKGEDHQELSDLYTALYRLYSNKFNIKPTRDEIEIKPLYNSMWSDSDFAGSYRTNAEAVVGEAQEHKESDGSLMTDRKWAEKLASMVGFMKKKGLKLDPLPDIILRKEDQGNGILDKTGQYNPETNVLELFTCGRHVKDIGRSFFHEMWHVHQNHSGKLKPVTTEKVTEDSDLNDIEGETFREGNLLYREWLETQGGYSGNLTEGKDFHEKHGIKEVSTGLGFSEKEQKWYGWSHRAIHGFGIGDNYLELYPDETKKGKKIKTLEQAKEAAKKFADSVS